MTEPEMNVKLCEALGWRKEGKWWADPEGDLLSASDLPNHFADTAEGLWACHQAEKTLRERKVNSWHRYVDTLRAEVDGFLGDDISASAPQRALALYRTLCP